MNVRQPMGVLYSFSIENILFDKIDLRFIFFWRNTTQLVNDRSDSMIIGLSVFKVNNKDTRMTSTSMTERFCENK